VIARHRQERDTKREVFDRTFSGKERRIRAAEVTVVQPFLAGHVDNIAGMDHHAAPTLSRFGKDGIADHLPRNRFLR
jgi:hypothetical protein